MRRMVNFDSGDGNDGKCDEGACNYGVKACSAFCSCQNETSGYNGDRFRVWHGIVKYEKGEIYYASIIPKSEDPNIQDNWTRDDNGAGEGPFLKRNLLFPTNITELGSSTFCDIDDQPFLIDKLEATSYKVSEQPVKSPGLINISTYADIGCSSTKCINPKTVVMSSQLGVEVLDITDQDTELGTCKAFFDHDDDTREFFCKRFDTFINVDLDIHYNLTASPLRENIYSRYDEVPDGWPNVNVGLGNTPSLDTLNDGEGFLNGDRCKMGNSTSPKFIYGMESRLDDLEDSPTTLSMNGTTGVSFQTTQTPYYFFFGLVPGKTALHKTVGKFFADKINEETLLGNGLEGGTSPTQPGGTEQSPASLLASCLNK